MTPAAHLRHLCTLALLLLTASASAQPAPGDRPGLAVLPVATATGVPAGAGPTLAGLLVAGIDADRYALVERAQTAQLLEETRLQDTELSLIHI